MADRAVHSTSMVSDHVSAKYLTSEITTEVVMPKLIPIEQLINQKFGRLTIIGETESLIRKNSYKERRFFCKCDCGNTITVQFNNLKSGNTSSCGCLHSEISSILYQTGRFGIKHGKCNDTLYGVWRGMKSRCYGVKQRAYKNYGGRGISICNEWLNDFMNFYNWAVVNGYKKGLQIDRINNDGNYEPTNCRWITNKENMRNRGSNKLKLEDVWDIRNAYLLGCFTQKEIAVAYGISKRHAQTIISNNTWT